MLSIVPTGKAADGVVGVKIASIPSEKREWSEMEQISTINFVRSRGFVEKG